ncbi:MAG: hypothetical protein JJU00_06800 [Opitutales bacterium]|nr:hypothetical protein [Opitutales bacterium]
MKIPLALLFLLSLCAVAPLFADTLAEWNFNNLAATTTSGGNNEFFDADAGAGTLYVNQSNYTGGTNFVRDTGNGTTVNASPGTEAGGYIRLQRASRWNNGVIEARVDTTGYVGIRFSFAFRFADSAFPGSTTVEWSGDGGATYETFETYSNTPLTAWTALSFDFSGFTALDNNPDVRVRLRFSADGGGVGTTNGGHFDNIRVEGELDDGVAPATVTVLAQPARTFIPVDEELPGTVPATEVLVEDADGVPVRWGVPVTATLQPGSFAPDSTTTVAADFNGVAHFDNLRIDEVGTDYRITFTVADLPGLQSQPFDATPVVPPEMLEILTAPGETGAYAAPTPVEPAPSVRAALLDGTPVPFAEVTASLSPEPFAAESTVTVTTGVDGVATFADLLLPAIGTDYRITFSAEGAEPVESPAFDFVFVPREGRLFATAERLEAIRAAAAVPGSHHAEVVGAMRARADAGASAYRGGFHEDRADYLNAWYAREAALLYLVTDEQQYADKALEALQAISGGGITHSNGLWRAAVTLGFAFAYDWAKEGWSESDREWVRERIEAGLDQWPSFSHPNFQNPGASNWVAVCRSAELLLILAAGEETERASRMDSLIFLLDRHSGVAYGSAGYTQEGLGYKNYGGSFLYPAALALEEVTGNTALSAPLRDRAPWRMMMYAVSFAYSSLDAHRRDMPIYPFTGVANPDFYEEGLLSTLLGFVDGHADAPYYRHFYDRVTGVVSPLPPAAKYDQHRAGTTYALLFYPTEGESADPTGLWPAAIEDNHGAHFFRNRWRDTHDTLGNLMADNDHQPRAWNAEETLAMSLFSNNSLFFHGPGTGTSVPTNYTSILVDGARPTNNETGRRVSFATDTDTADIVVESGSAYNHLGMVEPIRRQLVVDFRGRRDNGSALFSSFDAFTADQTRTVTWHANLTSPRATAIQLTVGSEGGRASFLLRGNGESYLKGWVMHPANASVTTDGGNLGIHTEAQAGEIWVAWMTGDGTPPTGEIAGTGLDARLTVDGSELRFDADAGRVVSKPLGIGDEGTFVAWHRQRFGEDPASGDRWTDDPDNRGISLGVEFALALDLLDNAHDGLPGVDAAPAIHFNRRPAADVRLVVEAASTLEAGAWTEVATLEPGASSWSGPATVEEEVNGDTIRVTVTDPVGTGADHSVRLLRLRLDWP